jgi:hypothetical protein
LRGSFATTRLKNDRHYVLRVIDRLTSTSADLVAMTGRRTLGAAIVAAVAICLVAGCGAAASPSAPAASGKVQRLAVPAADYFGLAWVSDDVIVMAWAPPLGGGPAEPAHLVKVGTTAASVTPLPFAPTNAECWRIREARPIRLPDGRLGFVRECQPRQFKGIDFSIIWYDIVAMDLRDGHQEVLARLDNTDLHGGNRILYAISLKPSLKEGVAYLGNRICDAAVAFDASGIRPLDMTLGAEPSAPNLNEPFNQDCASTINARSPEWSPDGGRLAVLVSTDAKGRDGFSRMDVGWDLVVVNATTGMSERWLSGLAEPDDVAWSPDGRWLLVTSYDAQQNTSTISLVSPAAPGDTRRISLGERVTSIAWSPDSTRLAGLDDATTNAAAGEQLYVPVLVDLSSNLAP